jgi:ABC-type multidrug transport system permease subunit
VTPLRILLAKDLRRAWRNPVPWLVSLAVPLVITGLIGVAFSPQTGGGGLGRITFALVDEDDSSLTRFIRSSLTGREAGEHLDVRALGREEALRRITDNQLAAVVIIPKGFTREYFGGRATALDLVKNPAQAIHPAVVEEGLGLLVTTLNAVGRTLGDDLAEWGELLDSADRFDLDAAGRALRHTGDRLAPAKAYLNPPLVSYRQEARAKASGPAPAPAWSIFAFLLVGMGAMFLLYIADNAMRDLYRELRFHTLERFQTLHEGLFVLIAGKAVFAVAAVLVGAAILFGGGALVFRFAWQQPFALAALVAAYALFAAGFMGLLAALAGNERRAEILNNVIVMVVSLAGGCMFPPQQLPAFMRDHVTPLLPTAWFAAAGRALQENGAYLGWVGAAGKLAGLGVALLMLAAVLLRRRLQRGAPA